MHPPPGLADFCEANKKRLVGVLTLQCGDPHTAEELAQETLARVCTHWRSVARMNNPEAWMFRVAMNLTNSYFRRKLVERNVKEHLGADVPHQELDMSDAVAVRQALADIPKRQRSVLVLRFYADLSVHEVATALGIPEGTVKTLTRRGLKLLRQSMNPTDLQEVPNVS